MDTHDTPVDTSLSHRQTLIETLRRDDRLHSERVAMAMRDVPREAFVPGVSLDEVYRAADAIVTKRIDGVSVSSASSPEVVALMLEQLDPRPGDRVLEIGAGTGYNAALLQHMVGPDGHVVTIDIDEDLVLSAREHLAAVGYREVQVVKTDGALGFPSAEPFDRIMLTVASSDVAPAWREQLARPHGRLVLPLALHGLQRSVAFVPADDHLLSESVRNCSFIPLRGLLATGAARTPLDADGRLVLTGAPDPLPQPVERIRALLDGSFKALAWPTGVSTNVDELRTGLQLWLVSHDRGTCTLWGADAHVPDLFGLPERTAARGTLCVLDSTGLVVLAWSDASHYAGELLLQVPRGSERLAARCADLIQRWAARGRPDDEALNIHGYPRGGTPLAASRDAVTIEQRWMTFVLEWEDAGAQPPAILTV